MKKSWFAIWIFFICLVPFIYFILGKELIISAFKGEAPHWVDRVIQTFYPRFVVEKHRFNLSFFVEKADGVIIRFCLVQISLLVFALNYTYRAWFYNRVTSFWNKTVSVRHVHWLRIVFYAGVICFTYDWAYFLEILSPAAIFYKPVLLLKIFHIGFPSIKIIKTLHGLLIIGCISVIFRVKPIICSILVTLLFLLMQGWLYSFEKMDHTFATLTYALLLMPFVVIEQEKAIRSQQKAVPGWPLQLICMFIALVYLMAGLEKLLIAGTDWVKPESFRSYLYLHQAPLGLWVAKNDVLSTILPALAMLFQLSFISILFYPKLILVYIIGGIAFHTGNYLLLHVGWYINAWIFVYIFFFDWERIHQLLYTYLVKKAPQ